VFGSPELCSGLPGLRPYGTSEAATSRPSPQLPESPQQSAYFTKEQLVAIQKEQQLQLRELQNKIEK